MKRSEFYLQFEYKYRWICIAWYGVTHPRQNSKAFESYRCCLTKERKMYQKKNQTQERHKQRKNAMQWPWLLLVLLEEGNSPIIDQTKLTILTYCPNGHSTITFTLLYGNYGGNKYMVSVKNSNKHIEQNGVSYNIL